MKLNSPQSIATALKVFRSYDGSWMAAREAARRDADGVLVIPKRKSPQPQAAPAVIQRKAG